MPISLVLADDHPLILDGLQRLFESEAGIEVKARCVNGEEALRAVRKHRPDIIVLDLRMPGLDGLSVLRAIREERLPTKVVVLTAGVDEAEVRAAIREGAEAVLLKESASRTLVRCLSEVRAGKRWIDERLERSTERSVGGSGGARAELRETLTPRELAVVQLVSKGHRNREIGEKLSISEGTVKLHLHNIYEKLSLDGRVALVLYAQDAGLV